MKELTKEQIEFTDQITKKLIDEFNPKEQRTFLNNIYEQIKVNYENTLSQKGKEFAIAKENFNVFSEQNE